MFSIATLLENQERQTILDYCRICGAYGSFNSILGVERLHFSWLVAGELDQGKIVPILESIANDSKTFTVQTGGIGIFPGKNPVLTISLARNESLTRMQMEIWERCSSHTKMTSQFSEPNAWMPHITILPDSTSDVLFKQALHDLAYKELRVEIMVDQLSILFKKDTENGVFLELPFKGKNG